MQWDKRELDSFDVKDISRQYGSDLLVSSILLRREITDSKQIPFFLEDDLRFLHNPFLFVEMGKAVDRINAAVDSGETIFIYGDRDVDGIASTALMVEILEDFGAKIEWDLPRGDDAYGLSTDTVKKAASLGASLLITVDCGISNWREIQFARENNIDTIIVDHHNPQKNLPQSIATINPKLEDSGYPFRDLSACGVVAKLYWGLNFSRTELYGKIVTLMNVKPLNDSFLIEVCKLENFVETARMSENLVPGIIKPDKARFLSFIEGSILFVFNQDIQLRQLKKIFNADFIIPITDITPLLEEYLPALAGKSLLEIMEISKIARYQISDSDELSMLASLFVSLILRKEELLSHSYAERMDLVALATLADIMPLVDENRVLVRKGIDVINHSSRSSIRELLIRKGLWGRQINSNDISWRISPIINSTGRMGEPEKAVQLLLSESQDEIENLVSQIVNMDRRRRKIEGKVWDESLATAKKNYNTSGNRCVLVSGRNISRGITGLLATRLMTFFKVPAIVISIMSDRAAGSVRSPRGYKIMSFLESFRDIFTDFGGHDFAAGFTMHADRVPAFQERLFTVADSLRKEKSDQQIIRIDAEVPPDYLTPELWKVVELFEPYGEGNPPLVFLTKGMIIQSCELFGRKAILHLKMLLDSGKYKWPAVIWNGSEQAQKYKPSDRVDVVYQLRKVEFRNNETFQLTVMDLKK